VKRSWFGEISVFHINGFGSHQALGLMRVAASRRKASVRGSVARTAHP
jgi:hypothetical protein